MSTGIGNLPYTMAPVSPFDVITSQAENEMIANIESLANGTGIGDAAVTPDKISWPSWPYASVQSTSSFSTASTTMTNVTGLTQSLTVPAGGGKYKFSVSAVSLYNSGNNFTEIEFYDGTTSYGIGAKYARVNASSSYDYFYGFRLVTLAAGSYTITVRIRTTNAATNALLVGEVDRPAIFEIERKG